MTIAFARNGGSLITAAKLRYQVAVGPVGAVGAVGARSELLGTQESPIPRPARQGRAVPAGLGDQQQGILDMGP